ncbi:MAG: YaiO family outer membrane beta-barrel protein [Candidatus Margulisiibacteriota bacterium]
MKSVYCSPIAILSLFILTAVSFADAPKFEFDYTKETLSNGQYYNTSYFYVTKKTANNTMVISVQNSDRNGAKDTSFSLGDYFDISSELYGYINTIINPSPNVLPQNSLELEAGWSRLKPAVLIANYKRRNYPSLFVEIYGIGTDYYFIFPGWLYARIYCSKSSDGITTTSGVTKIFYEPNEKLRLYIGYATGSEAYKDISSAAVFGFKANTPMAGVQYKINDNYGIKADISREYRDSGVIDSLLNIGAFSQW